jgi:YjbR protein
MDDVPPEILDRLSAICLGLPEAYEEPAWTGIRWRVRKRTFAHVRTIGSGEGTVTRMTFRAPAEELDALASSGPPYYRADWGRDVVGIVLGADTDWPEVAELLTDSFCVMAPQKLIARIDRPIVHQVDAAPPDDTLGTSHTRQNG